MNSRSTVVRAAACVAIVAVTATCGPDTPGSSSESASLDSAAGAGPSGGSDTSHIGADASSGPASSVQPSEDLITADGWGPLRIGMTRAEIVAAAGEDANPEAIGGPEPEHCDQFRPNSAPAGLLVMVEEGILTRISVSRNSDIATPEGISVGDPAASVLEAYEYRATVAPHKYWQSPAKYIDVWSVTSSGGRRGIRYEINPEDEVAHIHVGGPSIEYVEGCM